MKSMTMSKGCKVMHLANDEKLDEALYQWFVQKIKFRYTYLLVVLFFAKKLCNFTSCSMKES